MSRLVVLAALAGCSFSVTGAPGGDDGGPVDDAPGDAAFDGSSDGPPDAPPDAHPCVGWTAKHFMPCTLGAPQPGPTLTVAGSPYVYDTSNQGGVLRDVNNQQVFASGETVSQSSGPTLAVMNVNAFEIPAGVVVNVRGSKPLLIASWSSIQVLGTLDAGSTTVETDPTNGIDGEGRTGPGSHPGVCSNGGGKNGMNAQSSGGSGGGGGGGSASAGGNGRYGDGNTNIAGGAGGTALSRPVIIRGGCNGGASGTAGSGAQSPATSSAISVGGRGGGAVELAAREAISVLGIINAGGAGGAGAPQGSACGGGGGGSGGYIGLDSPSVNVTGTLGANGGGGGGSAPFAGRGNRGANATSHLSANGGGAHGGTCGLAGAPGNSGTNPAGGNASGSDACGGGGGGGAAGFIHVYSPMFLKPGAAISPAEALNPP